MNENEPRITESAPSKAIPVSEGTVANINFLDDRISLLDKKITNESLENKQTISRIETITYLGFIIIVLMAVAIVISYFEFLYSEIKNDNYKNNNLSETISITTNSIKILKTCLSDSGWLNPKCLEN
jgi:hypothetical protein